MIITKPATDKGATLTIRVTGTINNSIVYTSSVRICGNVDVTATTPTGRRVRNIPRVLGRFLRHSISFSISSFYSTTGSTISRVATTNSIPIVTNKAKLFVSDFISGVSFSSTGPSRRLHTHLSTLSRSRLCSHLLRASPTRTRGARGGGGGHIVHTLRVCCSAKGAGARRSLLSERDSPCRALCLIVNFGGQSLLCSHVGTEISGVITSNLVRRTGTGLTSNNGATTRTVNRGRLTPCFTNRVSLRRTLRGVGHRAHHCTGQRVA